MVTLLPVFSVLLLSLIIATALLLNKSEGDDDDDEDENDCEQLILPTAELAGDSAAIVGGDRD